MAQAGRTIKAGAFDTCGNEKDSIVITGWVLDTVLDADKLQRAFEQLVQHWPILSARLRKDKSVSTIHCALVSLTSS